MLEPRSRMEARPKEARPKLARWSTLLAMTALLAAACTNAPAASSGASAAASAPASSAAASVAPSTAASEAPSASASEAPASEAPSGSASASASASAGGESFKIGYISLGDSVPFVKLVSDGIRQAAEDAGQELLFCDSEIDAAKALS
nr:hypothetical protein [Chloroflexota bacterium]